MAITFSEIRLKLGTATIGATLAVPADASALVIFAHGSGSSRLSGRNRYVAQLLQQRNLATLLIDLLTKEEAAIDDQTRAYRFDIPLLARRVVGSIAAARQLAALHQASKSIGLFGASTGAAAALIAAAECPHEVQAVVSRGGRPDLAAEALSRVEAPTLFIVGGEDDACIPLNRSAYGRLHCAKRLEIVPGATHLFEEPGTLTKAADMAADWFVQYLLD